MLDFYLLADSQPKPGRNAKLEYIGGIEDDLFFQLQKESIIEPWFDYYSSFRWSSELVARVLLKLQQQKPVTLLKGRVAFISLLQKAVDVNCGIMAFGD